MKNAGLLGFPLSHSISPAMHNAAFAALGIEAEYSLFETPHSEVKETIDNFKAHNFMGFNVTIPYKEIVMNYIDETTKLAKLIGAVNTVQNSDGKLIGYNTDGPGFIDSLKEDAGFEPKGKSAVVLGAGGAGKAVSVMLAECGVKNLVISDIDEPKARTLTHYISSKLGCECLFSPLKDIESHIIKADLLVNATPIGMYPNINDCPLPDDIKLRPKLTVYDLVYNPQETKLLKIAKTAKAKCVSGIGMLIRQGALAFSIFTDEEAPIDIIWTAAHHALTKINH